MTFIKQDGEILKYDPQTKKIIQQTALKINSDKPLVVVEYDKNTGNKVKQKKYQDNEDIVQLVIDYNPAIQDKKTKITHFKVDGISPLVVVEFDEVTGNVLECIEYQQDKNIIDTITLYDPQEDEKIKMATKYKQDGINHSIVLEFDPITGNKKQETHYQTSNNCVNFVIDYNPAIQDKKTKITYFKADGKTPFTVLTFDENTGNNQLIKKITDFNADGKTPSKVTEFNDKGKKEKYIQYKDDENIIELTKEYDPTTGKLIKEIEFKGDGINPLIMSIYDKDTGNIIEYREYQDEANLIECLYTYNPNIKERKKQEKHFKSDGTSLLIVVDFDADTGNENKITKYQDNEDKIETVIENDPQVKDKITQSTKYKPDGINPLIISQYDENTKNIKKEKKYQKDNIRKEQIIELIHKRQREKQK